MKIKAGISKVALVIPVFNRRETTLRALRSLSRLDTAGLEIKIFVVDDGSTDGTSEAIRQYFPETELIQGDGNLHYAGGTNRGISSALEWAPDFVVIMNDDAVFHSKFLRRLVDTSEANPRSVVGALLLLWDQPHKVFQVGQKWSTWHGGWQMPHDLTAFSIPSTPFAVECLVGNCVLLPIGAIDECGLMDEKRFPHGWGDAQYMVRMRRSGWTLLVDPKAYVWCEPNTYPPPLHLSSAKKVLRTLFLDTRHPLNLSRQFWARWDSAPSRVAGVFAFVVYCSQIILKTFVYGFARLLRR